MSTAPETPAIPTDEATRFYDGALRRAQRVTLALAAAGVFGTLALGKWRVAAPLVLGTAVGWMNLRWLVASCAGLLSKVQALTDAAGGQPPVNLPGGAGSVARFLLRYLLLGAAAYVIVICSVFSVLAFFCGLFLPVGALMIEAAFEVWVAYRRGL